jgi:hypothetical protein
MVPGAVADANIVEHRLNAVLISPTLVESGSLGVIGV